MTVKQMFLDIFWDGIGRKQDREVANKIVNIIQTNKLPMYAVNIVLKNWRNQKDNKRIASYVYEILWKTKEADGI